MKIRDLGRPQPADDDSHWLDVLAGRAGGQDATSTEATIVRDVVHAEYATEPSADPALARALQPEEGRRRFDLVLQALALPEPTVAAAPRPVAKRAGVLWSWRWPRNLLPAAAGLAAATAVVLLLVGQDGRSDIPLEITARHPQWPAATQQIAARASLRLVDADPARRAIAVQRAAATAGAQANIFVGERRLYVAIDAPGGWTAALRQSLAEVGVPAGAATTVVEIVGPAAP